MARGKSEGNTKDKARNKSVPWAKVKKEYLEGVTTKELAKKYNISAKVIQDKAGHEKWTVEKSLIYKNIHENVQDRIQGLTNKALNALEEVIEDDLAKDTDKVSAAKAILDISGLKTSKQEITTNQPSLAVEVKESEIKKVIEQINSLADE